MKQTKLGFANPYQSGEGYEVNELVYYNGGLRIVQTAIAQGSAATGAEFMSPVSPEWDYSTFRVVSGTKKVSIDPSAVADGTTRTLSMPNANVNLGKVPTGLSYSASTGVLTLANTDGVNTTASLSVPVELAASSTNQPLSANTIYTIPRLYAGALVLDLPTGARVGDTIVIRDTVTTSTDTNSGIQAISSLTVNSDVIQASTGSYSFNWKRTTPVYDAPGLVGGGEIVFTRTSSNWFVSFRYGKQIPSTTRIVNPAVAYGFVELNASAVTANQVRVLTFPDANVNLGAVLGVPLYNTLNGSSVTGVQSAVVAGPNNSAAGFGSTILAGGFNTIASSGAYAFIGGGSYNTVNASYAFCITGIGNSVTAASSGVVTGDANSVSAARSIVLNGSSNVIGSGKTDVTLISGLAVPTSRLIMGDVVTGSPLGGTARQRPANKHNRLAGQFASGASSVILSTDGSSAGTANQIIAGDNGGSNEAHMAVHLITFFVFSHTAGRRLHWAGVRKVTTVRDCFASSSVVVASETIGTDCGSAGWTTAPNLSFAISGSSLSTTNFLEVTATANSADTAITVYVSAVVESTYNTL